MITERDEVVESHLTELAGKIFGQLIAQCGTLHSASLQRNLTVKDVEQAVYRVYGIAGTDPAAQQAADDYAYRLAKAARCGQQGSKTDELATRLRRKLPQLLERCLHETDFVRSRAEKTESAPATAAGS